MGEFVPQLPFAMYKATHTYKATADHVLSFAHGESLCVLEDSNEGWWLALNAQGKVGYVPKNYVDKEKDDSNVALRSVNNAIEEILASAPPGNLQPNQQAILKKLLSHKEALTNEAKKSRQGSAKRRAPLPPNAESGTERPSSAAPARGGPPPVPQRNTGIALLSTSGSSVKSCETQIGNLSLDVDVDQVKVPSPVCDTFTESSNLPQHAPISYDVPGDIGSNLLSVLKNSLNSDEAKCRTALLSIFGILENTFPSMHELFANIMDTVPEKTTDGKSDKLALALENIREIKNDAQQRNWAIEDDEDKIAEILTEILTELTTVEGEHSIFALSHDHYLPIHSLVEYHQMETRVALRLTILQIFGVMCSLSKVVVSTLLVTVLPLELSMDIMSHTEDTQRTCYSALVMSMLFSTAEPPPVGHYDRLNKSFVQYLIQYIEGNTDLAEHDDQVVGMFVNILLSFNLHFLIPSDNMIMQVISERETCTLLGEKIMILVNRGDDPVAMEEHWAADDCGRPPPSVIKFLQDIYSQRCTSTFLYTNDMNVLLDIVARNLTDLPSGNKLRTEYLDLLLNILANTDYSENRHRSIDIAQSLNRIQGEEQLDNETEQQILDFDKKIVEKIFATFGEILV